GGVGATEVAAGTVEAVEVVVVELGVTSVVPSGDAIVVRRCEPFGPTLAAAATARTSITTAALATLWRTAARRRARATTSANRSVVAAVNCPASRKALLRRRPRSSSSCMSTSLRSWIEQTGQPQPRLGQLRLDGAHRAAERLGNIALGQVIEVTQNDTS